MNSVMFVCVCVRVAYFWACVCVWACALENGNAETKNIYHFKQLSSFNFVKMFKEERIVFKMAFERHAR
ncbi:hypothetical protein T4A_13082 [Trichinella pseudospiralis]|uniref:Secreted protein n=1 Tax=Trichinella pseudospiralis TaxID=6337 RepID=A0A0V1EKQ7_TRIPS|nr:hypothetical protein T4A_13082 [Trichinella pseudospiralis]